MCFKAFYICEGCGNQYTNTNNFKGERVECKCCNKFNTPRQEVFMFYIKKSVQLEINISELVGLINDNCFRYSRPKLMTKNAQQEPMNNLVARNVNESKRK